jgi:predicted O-linked N-acetylglucosamine transferase (SPINDLY family)
VQLTTAKNEDTNVGQVLAKAAACHRAGNLAEAERLFTTVLDIEPGNATALSLLGTLHAQRGNFEQAIDLIARSLQIEPRQPFALNSQGNALNGLKRYSEALASFEKAIVLKPDHAAAFNNRGSTLRGLRQFARALASIEQAIRLRPDYAEALNNRGLALQDLGRCGDALASYDKAIVLDPDNAMFHVNRAGALAALGRHAEALASCDRAIALDPRCADAHYGRGDVLCALDRCEDSVRSYGIGISLRPNADACRKRGNALRQLGRTAEALASYDEGLAVDPASVLGNFDRALALQESERHEGALVSYDRVVALQPGFAEAHNNRGNVLAMLQRHEDALNSYNRAIALKPDFASAFKNRSNALVSLGRYPDALESIEKAMALDPQFAYAHGTRLDIKMHMCDWSGLDELRASVIEGVRRGRRASGPFPFLSVGCAPQLQQRCAELFIADRHPLQTMPRRMRSVPSEARRRIRVAYLSGDFHSHAVPRLMAGVFEQHDREQFEVHAISYGKDDQSEMRARLKNAFEHFVDVRFKSDRDIAELLAGREIEIVVDLKGLSGGCRPGILAFRPCPIQVNYLGYPGTMGAGYIDYIVADRIVIPEEHAVGYNESLVYLPDTYQCNDRKRQIATMAPTRSEAGLPDHGFVFCSFNKNFKIAPETFDCWMRLLETMQDSVLWLYHSNASAARNLRREAEKRGVAQERLIFAESLSNADHLARHRLADLFLDTLPYGAHTTASDALWAGLPVLTCLGRSFAGRVGASLLHAVGLLEMVTGSLEEYEARALSLARDPAALAAVKAKLARNRETYPLFDTARFTRHLEAAYTTMIERHREGRSPVSFSVGPEATELEARGSILR